MKTKRKKRGGSAKIDEFRKGYLSGEPPSSLFNPFGLWDVQLKNGKKVYMHIPPEASRQGAQLNFYPGTRDPEGIIKGDPDEDQLIDGWMVITDFKLDSQERKLIGKFYHTFFYPHRYNISTGRQTPILDKYMWKLGDINYYESWKNFGDVTLTFYEGNRSFKGEMVLNQIFRINPSNNSIKTPKEPPDLEIEEKIRERFDNWTELKGEIVESQLSEHKAAFEDVPFESGKISRRFPSFEFAKKRGSLLQRASLLAPRDPNLLRPSYLSYWPGDKSHLFQLVKEESSKLPFSEYKEMALIELLFEKYVEEISKNVFISQGIGEPSITNINLLADYIKTLGWLSEVLR